MSSAGLTPLPTSVHHTTARLTHSQAHSFLSEFLERAENDAAYRPDSMLTESGPQALSSGSSPNLTLSHLNRVLKGMEGRRVGGGLKLADQSGEEENAVKDSEEPGAEITGFEDREVEVQQQQKKKGGKRALDTEDEQHTSKSKKQKRKIISSANAERADDPTGGAVLEATLETGNADQDDWQDAQTYALAQDELNHEDAARPEDNDDGVFEGGGQDDMRGDEELDFEEFGAANRIENEKHPGADLPQSKNETEERELVSVRVEGTGEGLDPRARGEKKPKKQKERDKDESEKTHPSTNTEKARKKRESKDRDEDGDVAMTDGMSRSTSKAKRNDDEIKGVQNLSKEERKKLKKLRHKDTKREREEERLARRSK